MVVEELEMVVEELELVVEELVGMMAEEELTGTLGEIIIIVMFFDHVILKIIIIITNNVPTLMILRIKKIKILIL